MNRHRVVAKVESQSLYWASRRGQDGLVRCLSPLGRLHVGVPKAAEVLLLFVDRDDHYRYYPLRRGTVYETWERDDRLYFRVQLAEFIASDPRQIDAVSSRIKSTLDNAGPRSAADPKHPTRDGCYAIRGADAVLGQTDVLVGEDAWSAAVECLKATKQFSSSRSRQVVFVRTDLERRGGKRCERPELSGSFERISISRDTPYEMRLSYRTFADQLELPAAEIAVGHGDSIQILSTASVLVQAPADDVVLPMVTKRYPEDRYSHLAVSVRGSGAVPGVAVVGPSLNLPLALREPKLFWLNVGSWLVVFAISSLVVDLKPSDIVQTSSIPNFGRALLGQVTLWRIGAAIIQAIVLFVLLRIVGKKPV